MTRIQATIGLLLLLIAAILGVAVACDPLDLLPTDSTSTSTSTTTATATSAIDGTLPPEDHTASFKEFVLIDRVSEPAWLSQVTSVTFADGALTAATQLPSSWRDADDPTRPAESICTQLFAYAQRGANLAWTSLHVNASDGTALVTRTDPAGSCAQA